MSITQHGVKEVTEKSIYDTIYIKKVGKKYLCCWKSGK